MWLKIIKSYTQKRIWLYVFLNWRFTKNIQNTNIGLIQGITLNGYIENFDLSVRTAVQRIKYLKKQTRQLKLFYFFVVFMVFPRQNIYRFLHWRLVKTLLLSFWKYKHLKMQFITKYIKRCFISPRTNSTISFFTTTSLSIGRWCSSNHLVLQI